MGLRKGRAHAAAGGGAIEGVVTKAVSLGLRKERIYINIYIIYICIYIYMYIYICIYIYSYMFVGRKAVAYTCTVLYCKFHY